MNGDVPSSARALVIGAERRLTLVERALPAPRPGDVLVAIAGCAAGDAALLALDLGPGGACPGGALFGTVVAAPATERDLAPGRAVVVPARLPCGACAACRHGRAEACPAPLPLLPGGLASHAWVPAASAVPLAHGLERAAPLGWRLAAAGGPLLLAYHGLARAGLMPGDVAVFLGLDATGLCGVQIAAADGAVAFAVDDREARLDTVRAQGAQGCICSAELDPAALAAALDALAVEHGRAGARRLVVCRATGTRGLARAVAAVPPGGSLLVLGRPPAGAALDAAALAARAALVVLVEEGHPDLLPECLALCARGAVALEPLVRDCAFTAADEALAALRAGDDAVVPIVRPVESATK
ncbi:MAG TPA: alcohol dehydrogenase catalytic domain-containing protein [Polyangia bacterium]|jgi:6-hydroxycyclohex-1-ene-1-carbonyl-CoA dehydrogenase